MTTIAYPNAAILWNSIEFRGSSPRRAETPPVHMETECVVRSLFTEALWPDSLREVKLETPKVLDTDNVFLGQIPGHVLGGCVLGNAWHSFKYSNHNYMASPSSAIVVPN
jgi:hypothetical protein